MLRSGPLLMKIKTPVSVRHAGLVRLAHRVNPPLVAALRHPWVESIVRLSAVEDALTAVHPLLSLTQVRARVVRIIDETASTKTFVLQPNALWLGAQAGQFVRVQIEIAGRQVERAYSLSSRPGSRRIAITVKRQDQGLVSRYLHDAVKVGDILTLSQALGEFVLTSELPSKMLLLSAGSGITPVVAMLKNLQARGYRGDVVFLHGCHPADLIFAEQLATIARDFAELSLVINYSATEGRLTPQMLALEVPDLAQRSTWMCGPTGFMDAMTAYWEQQGFDAPLFSERFVGAPLLPSTAPGTPVQVSMLESGSTFATQGTEPLLMQAERAGLSVY